jgi:Protein of unknown function, DUF547
MRIVFAVLACIAGLAFARPAVAADHTAWDGLLSRYVRESADGVNRVNYAGWKASAADRAALAAYIRALEAERPSALPRAEAFAYWANLYNAVTVNVILARYPVASIRDIRSEGGGLKGFIGPWQTKLVTVEDRRLSLDDIEQGIMRPTFRDPRVHYAVNCASIGCPNLPRRAFRGDTLEADLDAAARAYINHPRGVRVTPQGLRLSSIYKWYAADFGDLKTHLERYVTPARAAEIRASARIAGYGYDWSLNGTEPAR